VIRLLRPTASVSAHQSLAEVEAVLRQSGGEDALVSNEEGTVLGTISTQDLVHARAGKLPDGEPPRVDPVALTAAAVARPLFIWLAPMATLLKASDIMGWTHQSRVVILERGRPMGEVRRTDVTKWMDGMSAVSKLTALRKRI
jgi:CBS domain-containing protein